MAANTTGSVNADDSEFYGPVVGVNLGTIIYGRPPEEAERDLLVRYLRRVTELHSTMHVVGLGSSRLDSGLDLASVYMMLAVQGRYRAVRPLTAEETEVYLQQRFVIPKELSADRCLPDHAVLSVGENEHSGMVSLFRAELATETVLDHHHLVLCGAPGSGKSTFAHHLVWALAQRGLDQINHHTGLLGWHDKQRLLPMVMPLRRLAGALVDSDLGLADNTPNMGVLRDAVCAYLQTKYGIEEPRTLLDAGLARSLKVLLVFDGLDEVPLEATPTSLDRMTVLRFIRRCAGVNARILITCRSRAWIDEYRQMTQWPMVELAPLTGGQMTQFIHTWFPQLHAKGVIAHEAIARLSQRLVQAFHDPNRDKLRKMAENPLLLSMIIFVMADSGKLPHDRARLYEQILAQLLEQWDAKRNGHDLAQAIGDERITGKKLRDFVLDRLCYQAHLATTSNDGRGQIEAMQLKQALMAYFAKIKIKTNDPYWAAERCVAYIDQRSGLLQPDDTGNVYTFAHLTLQEHCAGRHLLFEEPLQQTLALRRDDRWREPIFLGVGCLADDKRASSKIGEVLAALINPNEFRSSPRNPKHRYEWYRDLVLAAAIGADCDWDMLNGTDLDVEHFRGALRDGIVTLLEDRAHAQTALEYHHGQPMEPAPLLVRERQKAAELLAGLGDPRYPVSIKQWQQATGQLSTQFGCEGNHYWRYVPAGRYHVDGWHTKTADLQAYWVGRFMVTVEQYRAFMEAGGYTNDDWWTKRGLGWKNYNKLIEPSLWQTQTEQQYRNQPVCGVMWYEAVAYCQWLTEQLRPWLPKGHCVCLASEAEWYVAAAYNADCQHQPYPWGDQPVTPEHAVYDWSAEYRPLSVGLGLLGQSVCGTMDSVGNLWEWTATPSHQRLTVIMQQAVADSNDEMLARGGAYSSDSKDILCAAVGRSRPANGLHYLGFRCIIAPRSFVINPES